MTRTLPARLFVAGLLIAGLVGTSKAGIAVSFVESAPKDRFEIANTSTCELTGLQVEIDLTGTVGKLIFDTTGTGAGVEVFQPFEVREGPIALASGQVQDGDRKLVVSLGALKAGQKAAFTIDVDDTLKNSELGQIRVSGGEMQGGRVAVQLADGASVQAVFAQANRVEVPVAECAG